MHISVFILKKQQYKTNFPHIIILAYYLLYPLNKHLGVHNKYFTCFHLRHAAKNGHQV